MRRLVVFLCGLCRYSVDMADAARLLDLLKSRSISAYSMKFGESELFFSVSLVARRRLLRECQGAELEVRLVSEQGFPALLKRYRRRVGIALGVLLSAAIIALSGTVIWDIRIEGNIRLEEAEVREALEECGLTLGKVRRRLNTDAIENRVMIESDDISWISINIIGTVAEVQIRETEVIPKADELYGAANIVAAKDGYIEYFEDTRGNIIAEIGDYVREGELLVSGLYESDVGGRYYTSAKGRVMARTESEFAVSVPFEYQKKVYTGREYTEKYLIFFEKEIKFFGKCGNLPMSCDTIDTVEYCNFFSAGDLPIGIRTVRYLEYTFESDVRSDEEARELAFSEIGNKLLLLSERAQLLRRQTEFAVTDTAFTARCRVLAIEDIARIQEIQIS